MSDYDDKFPPSLSDEEKAALEWKIEQDYLHSHMGAVSFKDEYITFAIHFYTRNLYSLEDVVILYRAHLIAEKRRIVAHAFMTDMKSKLRAYELAHN